MWLLHCVKVVTPIYAGSNRWDVLGYKFESLVGLNLSYLN